MRHTRRLFFFFERTPGPLHWFSKKTSRTAFAGTFTLGELTRCGDRRKLLLTHYDCGSFPALFFPGPIIFGVAGRPAVGVSNIEKRFFTAVIVQRCHPVGTAVHDRMRPG